MRVAVFPLDGRSGRIGDALQAVAPSRVGIASELVIPAKAGIQCLSAQYTEMNKVAGWDSHPAVMKPPLSRE